MEALRQRVAEHQHCDFHLIFRLLRSFSRLHLSSPSELARRVISNLPGQFLCGEHGGGVQLKLWPLRIVENGLSYRAFLIRSLKDQADVGAVVRRVGHALIVAGRNQTFADRQAD